MYNLGICFKHQGRMMERLSLQISELYTLKLKLQISAIPREKPNRLQEVEDILGKTLEFLFGTLSHKTQNRASTRETLENCVTTLGNSKTKN